ncbi:MAG: tRNA adenosine(34) deaminase TadA [Candidatus Sumerlaeia bacterium]|nr:tRNA adenosine(34) deaminase TadA [Candidatus Sumerlaeia bacterium]
MLTEDERWMRRALGWARLAADRGEVPIGAVVVLGGDALAGAHDGKETLLEPTAHAEVLALREAAARHGGWRLDGATLYVTLEPCAMCAGAMVHARVARVVYGAANPRWGVESAGLEILANPRFNHRLEVVRGVLADEAAELLRGAFRRYRGAAP